MELFVKIVNGSESLTLFPESTILEDVLLVSGNALEGPKMYLIILLFMKK